LARALLSLTSLALLEALDLALYLLWITTVVQYVILDGLVLKEELRQLTTTLSHDIEEVLGDHRLVADSPIPNNVTNAFRDALSPQLTNLGCRLKVVPVV
jgi:hypothetical protein